MGQSYKIKKKISIIVLFFVIASQFCSCQKQQKVTFYVNPSASKIDVLLQEEKYEEVIEIYINQLKNAQEDSDEAAGTCLSIGDVYISYIKDRDKAIQYIEKAIEIDQKNQNKLGLADDYYVMSTVYTEMGGNIEDGIEFAEKAEELYKKYIGKDTKEVADTLFYKGVLYYMSEEWEKALENFESAKSTYELIHGETGYTCDYIGKTLLKLKEYDKAEEVLQEAIKLSKASGDEHSTASAELDLGQLYMETEDWEKAIDSLKKTLVFYESSTEYVSSAALVYNKLTFCAGKQSGRWESGMPYAIKACQTIEKIDALTEEEKTLQEKHKQLLRKYYDKWKPEADDQDFEVWYQKAVLDGEGWEEE